ncbi:MAG TPA: hypothetical protein DCE13_01530 [Cryomorphaceae bacterium]|jgi:hypothetical protein|nr:MAG: hypothetical protein ABR98_03190 [Cryomorphaceae bacterium BACL7 MAG-120910-bin2]KRO69181.1 MAG: hypothetical protein ABR88_04025 [Cryomorphaceae bacterium BACL7 MAG-120322-bin74]KRO83874.1 MAG: hypothetical protein ABR87_05210 [Cryomorphaceae bacterium BACL7 MAG-121220-bin83]HAB31202.1 hypothetical protein [Cryomorphaceae bacterium]
MLLPLLVLCVTTLSVAAQGPAVGQWRAHFPLRQTHSVAVLSEEILIASPFGLLHYDPADKVITASTVVEGLSDVDMTCMEGAPNGHLALLGYADGGMDIWSPQDVRRIGDIPNSGAYPGQSDIRALAFASNQRAFAATGFGIVEVNIPYGVVQGTYLLRDDGGTTPAFDLCVAGDSVFAATATGIWSAHLSDPLYLPSTWQQHGRWKDTAIAHLSVVGSARLVHPEGQPTVWCTQGVSWMTLPLDTANAPLVMRLRSFDTGFLVVRSYGVTKVDLSGGVGATFSTGFGNNEGFRPFDAQLDNGGVLWTANRGRGLTFFDNPSYAQHRAVEDPASSEAYAMNKAPNGVHVLTGAVDATWTASYTNEGILTFDGVNWTAQQGAALGGAKDILAVIHDPADQDHWFAASWGKGLLEFQNNQLLHTWNSSNSSLQSAMGSSPTDIRTGGLCWGQDGALWVSNALSGLPLHRYDPTTGVWQGFSAGSFNGESVKTLLQDEEGVFWMQSRTEGWMAIEVTGASTQTRRLTRGTGSGNLPSSNVPAALFDADGELWLGTSDGLMVCFSPYNAFNGKSIDAQALLVAENGINQKVLAGQNILSMALDGGNRKWIGTADAGVFLLSPDGLETIHHFTKEQSPLLSNRVQAIYVDPTSGEVFFGTNRGLLSFRSTATQTALTFQQVEVFPNPLKPEDFGPISVRGLVPESYVKVTDPNGRLVFEGPATGGQFTWDTYSLYGERVPSGIYLFWITDPLGSQTIMAQCVIVRGQ